MRARTGSFEEVRKQSVESEEAGKIVITAGLKIEIEAIYDCCGMSMTMSDRK
jgi:hypothetical protein